MNFALSTTIIILILLPGAIAIKAYYTSLRAKISDRHVSFNDLLLQGLLFTIAIHCCGICCIHMFSSKEIDFTFLYDIIVSDNKNKLQFTNSNFTVYVLDFFSYTVITTALSYISVKFFKAVVHALNWDLKFNVLSNANHWYLIFNKQYASRILHLQNTRQLSGKSKPGERSDQSNEIDFIIIDAYVAPDLLYSGVLTDFNYSPQKDELEDIHLIFCRRRKLSNTTKPMEPHCTSTMEIIPGELFVLPMKTIINLNIRYIVIDKTNGIGNTSRMTDQLADPDPITPEKLPPDNRNKIAVWLGIFLAGAGISYLVTKQKKARRKK